MNGPVSSSLRDAFLALQDAQERLAALKAELREPIAVIGLGCRIPGAPDPSPEGFWDQLQGGRDAVSAALPARWRDVGAQAREVPEPAHHAALLGAPDQFDEAFFGIAPREAASMDPQQRLLLEVAWEALEHAGIAPPSLYGSATGVYVGICTSDYSLLQLATTPLAEIDGHFGSGAAHSIASGRLSYLLGLRGPSLSIDTACSSSLVAVHQAIEALRLGDCDLALAGGVNVILSTEASRSFAQAGMLSPTGRCKSFSAGADGFVRGEGCGVVVLKRLRDAGAAGDRILAVIRGSAVNHDGPSSGLTVPSGLAQQALLRRALKAAGVAPSDVGYIEAHGTGTSLGDPIEAEALGAVLGAGRAADQKLLIGSVKTNIGHLEAAAGVAGLIKLVLALQHGELPGQLHFDAPSPHIRWDALNLEVVDRARPWAPINGRRIGGVSSFGFSGTNAHLVVEAAPDTPAAAAPAPNLAHDRPLDILPISARTQGALRTLAQAYRDRLAGLSRPDWADLCHTAAAGRAAFAHRVSVRAADAGAARAALDAFLAGQPHPALVKGEARPGARPRIGFLFTGQGSQFAGMGAALHAHSPSFRRIVERAEAALADRLPVPLGAVMRGEHPDAVALLNQTLYTQPALYVLEYGLAEFWRGLGVEPVAVLGHSLGEYVGCAVAGVFGFEDGLRLVADRARLMHGLPSDGAMLVVSASEAEIAPLLAGRAAEVSLAGVNAARQVTVSGARAAVEEIAAQCAARGWRTHALPVSQAFHSPLMEPIGAAFEARAGELAYAPARLAVISNLTGAPLQTVDAAYWRAHMRGAVRFADGLAALRALDCDVLLEVGPRPVLIQLARQAAAGQGASPGELKYLTSLKGPGSDDWDALCQAVQELHAAGAELDWAGWNRDYARRKVDAPTYPFERRRHWITPSASASASAPAPAGTHPLLGVRRPAALAVGQFDASLAAAGATAWLADHRIAGGAILPATGFIEMMLAAGQAVDTRWRDLAGLSILAPLHLPAGGARTVQTVIDESGESGARVRIFAAEADPSGMEAEGSDAPPRFRLHAEARLAPAAGAPGGPADLAAIKARCPRPIAGDAHYRQLANRGADFGPAFRGVRALWAGADEALAEIDTTLPPLAGARPHPALLDACLQTAAAVLDGTDTYLPVFLDRFECLATDWPPHILVHTRLTNPGHAAPEYDFTIHAEDGRTLARFNGLRLRNITAAAAEIAIQPWLYEVQWRPAPHSAAEAPAPAGRWLLLADRRGVAAALATHIAAAGGRCVLAEPGPDFRRISADHIELDPSAPDQLRALLALGDPAGFQGVVDCWPIDLGFGLDQPPAEAAAAQAVCYGAALNVIQALAARPSPSPLFLATSGAAPADGATGAPAHGLMSALRKTLQAEFPEIACRLVDLDAAASATESAASLAGELTRSDEPEVALRSKLRLAPRLTPAPSDMPACGEDTLVELAAPASGLIDDLRFVTRPRTAPGPDEVEIAVRAAGLNFRDVLNALNMLPGPRHRLGGECAGVIARAGAASGFKPGDAVMAFCPGQSGSFVTVPARHAARKPAQLDFAQAAGLPIAYLTALYGLDRLAALQPGETILIHAAAGGLGSAAMHLARARGAQVFATAGSAAKRDHVRALGAVSVASSRSLDFADAVLAETGGRGVDVVLNTLNGDFVPASFRSLAPGGRFLEVGKRGVFTPDQARAHRPDADYHLFDLGDASNADATLMPALLHDLYALLDSGVLPPLPVESVPYAEARQAFRKMAEARHIGKLVLSHGGAWARARGPGAAWVITGGFGALGQEAARWLADRGVETIVLAGPRRRGAAAIADIEARGATVIAAETDCADAAALRAIIAALPAGQTLRGVIHCAGALADATLAQQGADAFRRVADPKIAGALALHQATAGLDLAAFVLFSSASAVVGSAGQANYAAANAVLGAIARARRARGEAALCVDWGPWDAGMAASDRVQRRNLGLTPMAAPAGFAALERLLDSGAAQACVLPVRRWTDFFAAHPRERRDPFFAAVLPAAGPAGAEDPIAERLRAVSPQARRRTVQEHVRAELAKILGADPGIAIAPDVPLQELGFDSLMAVELRNVLAKSLGLALPPTLALDYPTLDALGAQLLARFFPGEAGEDAAPDDAAAIAALSEEDAEAMLLQELEALSA
jgi:acyl transferase domain-containing protein/acyl carrier protein